MGDYYVVRDNDRRLALAFIMLLPPGHHVLLAYSSPCAGGSMAMTPSAIAAVRCSSPAVWSSCSRSASLALRRRTGSTGGAAAPAAEGRTGMVRKLWPSGSVRAAAAAAAERLESGSGLG